MCISNYAQGLGCWTGVDPGQSNLGTSLKSYRDKVKYGKDPTFAQDNEKIDFDKKVIIFGCNEVADKTPIVNVPNRIVTSGHSGHYTLKGSINMRYYPVVDVTNDQQQYTRESVNAFWENAKASLPSKSGLPDFGTCIACLYFAKAMGNNDYMQNNDGSGACKRCYSNYCYEGLL